jgi:DNA polymerase III delta subunit
MNPSLYEYAHIDVEFGRNCQWWERKINNYIKNYARRNQLTLSKEQEQFFMETHERFLEAIPEEIRKYINRPTNE